MISIEKLQKFGLTSIEAQIYIYLLTEKAVGATQISKVVNIGRTNIYEHLKHLQEIGLIRQIEKRNKSFFEAQSPIYLKELGEKRISEARSIDSMISELIPKLTEDYYKKQSLPDIHYLHGEGGFDDLFDNIYLKGSEKEVFYFLKDLKDYQPPEPKYRYAILKKSIFTYLLINKAEDLDTFTRGEDRELRKTRLIDIPIEKDVIIYEDRLIAGRINKEDFSVVVIKDYDLSSMFAGLIKILS
jgi:sugar-specific transcriptional regulator TrmB